MENCAFICANLACCSFRDNPLLLASQVLVPRLQSAFSTLATVFSWDRPPLCILGWRIPVLTTCPYQVITSLSSAQSFPRSSAFPWSRNKSQIQRLSTVAQAESPRRGLYQFSVSFLDHDVAQIISLFVYLFSNVLTYICHFGMYSPWQTGTYLVFLGFFLQNFP